VSRFLLAAEAVRGDQVTFPPEESRHLARVLRLGVGDVVRALDGTGQELTVRLTGIAPRQVTGMVLARAPLRTESPLRLTLAQAVPRGDRIETVIRMATELGVHRFVPLVTARTVAVPARAATASRLARWQRVAREATKQCGRAAVPEVAAPVALASWLAARPAGGLLVCFWEEKAGQPGDPLPEQRFDDVTALVGPEGGLEAAEVEAARAAGAVVATMGPRVLRTDTAGVVAVALLQARYGDLPGPGAR
jgi:16S rRNA (uracil1498-N3)-methyltransferase